MEWPYIGWPDDVSDLDRWLMVQATDQVTQLFLLSGVILADRMEEKKQRKMFKYVHRASKLLPRPRASIRA